MALQQFNRMEHADAHAEIAIDIWLLGMSIRRCALTELISIEQKPRFR